MFPNRNYLSNFGYMWPGTTAKAPPENVVFSKTDVNCKECCCHCDRKSKWRNLVGYEAHVG